MRRLALALALVVLAGPLAVSAQQPAKVFRIGVLGNFPPTSPPSPLWEEFLRGLRELGYVEGQSVVFEHRYSEGRDERLAELAAELVRLKVDLIVATGGSPPYAAKRATSAIPIVFANNADPVGSGLVSSLARPGGNVTGLSLVSPEIMGKRLQLLKEAVPGVTRVAVLTNPASRVHGLSLTEAGAAARSLQLQLQVVEARGPVEFARAIAAATKEHAGALVVLGDPKFIGERARLAELAAKSRLPVMAAQREYAEAGALMAYGANLRELFHRAAGYVDKILKGARPGDLPIEQPTKFELIVNLKTARALGLTIPPAVLARADDVIQ